MLKRFFILLAFIFCLSIPVSAQTTFGQYFAGNGSPEGAITAPPGRLYIQLNATTKNFLWIKESGTGNTGWVQYTEQTSVTGNAGTATALQTARTIGGVSFDGTANIVPQTIQVVDSTDASSSILMVDSATGSLQPKTDGGLTYDATTGALTATSFVGPLTGNVTGNVSGSAATVTGAAQTAITSLGTLTVLQVDNLNLNGNTLSSTSGAVNITPVAGSAIVLDGTINIDAGVVTGATSITSTAFVGNLTGDVTGNVSGSSGSTTGNAATATALQTARTIGGVSFDGTANITVSTATGGFTVSGGALALGANNLTLTGSIASTGSRVTKGWFTDLEVTNAIAGSITGNAATVTTNANLTGPVTSVGNATTLAVTAITGQTEEATIASDDLILISDTSAAGALRKMTRANFIAGISGSGDVVGPASATDNAVVRFDSTTGKLVQNSVITIADTTGDLSSPGVANLGVGSSGAGAVVKVEGSQPSLTANAVTHTVVTDVPAAGTMYVWGATAATGVVFVTNSAGVMTVSHETTTGSGAFVRGTSPTVSGATLSGTTIASERFDLAGDISPSQITANQNDYNPTGLSTSSTLRLSSDASRNITGLAGGADGRIILIHNIGAQNIVLTDEDAGSTAGNRFALNASLTIGADQAAALQYDSTSSRWRLAATSVVGAGGAGNPGGSDTQVQRNNAGSFGGISGFTSDGTNVTAGSGNLRATRPRFTTSIDDANGNESFLLTATASAVNEFTVANAATGGSPTLSTTGGDTDIDLTLTPKGAGSVIVNGPLSVSPGSSVAGTFTTTEGTAPSLTANAFSIYSGTDVAAGGLAYVLPVAAASGVMRAANSSGVMTITHDAGISHLASSTSADLAGVLSNETGSGVAVFGTSPTIATPTISGAISFPDNTRQTFNPGANAAGLNVGSHAGDPDTPSNGDLWYDSTANELTARINGSNVALGAAGGGGIGGSVGTTDNAIPRANGTGGSTLQGSGVIIDDSNNLTAPGILSSGGGSPAGVLELIQGSAPSLGTTSVRRYAPTSVTSYAIVEPGAAGTGFILGSNSSNVVTTSFIGFEGAGNVVLATQPTNVVISAEATGNTITIPVKHWFDAAGANGATVGPMWDLPASNAPAAAVITGTNTLQGVLDFADGGTDLTAQRTIRLPSDWTGNVDVVFKWLSSTTSGNVVWGVSTSCVADAETNDPSFNSYSEVTDATKGTANQTNDASINAVTVTGCAAGELMHVRIARRLSQAGDTMSGTARLIGVEFTLRRAM